MTPQTAFLLFGLTCAALGGVCGYYVGKWRASKRHERMHAKDFVFESKLYGGTLVFSPMTRDERSGVKE